MAGFLTIESNQGNFTLYLRENLLLRRGQGKQLLEASAQFSERLDPSQKEHYEPAGWTLWSAQAKRTFEQECDLDRPQPNRSRSLKSAMSHEHPEELQRDEKADRYDTSWAARLSFDDGRESSRSRPLSHTPIPHHRHQLASYTRRAGRAQRHPGLGAGFCLFGGFYQYSCGRAVKYRRLRASGP